MKRKFSHKEIKYFRVSIFGFVSKHIGNNNIMKSLNHECFDINGLPGLIVMSVIVKEKVCKDQELKCQTLAGIFFSYRGYSSSHSLIVYFV